MSFNPPNQFQPPGQFKPAPQFQPINPAQPQFQPAPTGAPQFQPPGQFKPTGQPSSFTPAPLQNDPSKQFTPAPNPAMNMQPTGNQFQPVGAAPQFQPPGQFKPVQQFQPPGQAPSFQPLNQASATAPVSQPNPQPGQFKPAPSFQPAQTFQPAPQFKPVGQPGAPMSQPMNPTMSTPQPMNPVPNTAPAPFAAPKFGAPAAFVPAPAPSQPINNNNNMNAPFPPKADPTPMPQPVSNLPPMKQPMGANVFNPNAANMPNAGAGGGPLPPPQSAFNPTLATLPPPQGGNNMMPPQQHQPLPNPSTQASNTGMPMPMPMGPGPNNMAMPLGQNAPGLGQQGMHQPMPGQPPHPQQQNLEPIVPPHVVPPPSNHIQSCCDVFPSSLTLYNRSQLPHGIVITPYAQPDPAKGEQPVPLVDFGGHVIRCDHCRAYVNPFVSFRDRGVRWVCNFCHTPNATPDFYLCQVDPNTGYRSDVLNRTELTSSVYEMSAPEDYNTRDPVPPTFIFVINVSASALATGYLPTLCDTLMNSLDTLITSTTDPRVLAAHQQHAQQTGQSPKQSPSRGRIAFVTYDHDYHYYEFNPKSTFPHMHVGSSSVPIRSPVNESLLHCNIQECRPQIENFLRTLPSMFTLNQQDIHQNDACTATALEAVHSALQHVGGRIFLFTSQLPNVGPGALPTRADALLSRQGQHSPELIDSLLSKDKNGNTYYDALAFKFSRTHFSVDLFILTPPLSPNQNHPSSVDLATLSDVTRLTSGEMYYYPQYSDAENEGNNGKKESFKQDLFTAVTTPVAWEAVYRLRVAGDVMITDLYGNFSIRGSSLIILPSVDARKTLSFEFRPSEVPKAQQNRCIYIQGALLYTTSFAERRIRVISHCLPTTQYQQELYDKANAKVIATLLTKQCVGLSIPQLDGGLTKGRQHMLSRVIGLLKAFKAVNAQLATTNDYANLSLLPSLALGFAKSIAMRDMNDVHIDTRVYTLYKLISLNVSQITTFLKPQFYALHNNVITTGSNPNNEADRVCLPMQTNNPFAFPHALPPELPLSQQYLSNDGLFVLNNGFTIYIFIGAQFESANTAFMSQVFGLSSTNDSQLVLLPSPTASNQPLSPNNVLLYKLYSLISYLRSHQNGGSIGFQNLHIIRQSYMQQQTGVNAILPIELSAAFSEDSNANVMSLQLFYQLLFKP